MPRGKRKHGQFQFTIWSPRGSRLAVFSTEDQPIEKWAAGVREYAAMMVAFVASAEKEQENTKS